MQIKAEMPLEQFDCRQEVFYAGRPAGGHGAFRAKGKWKVRLSIPRSLGAREIIFAIHRDGEGATETHLPLLPSEDYGYDRTSIELDLKALCGDCGCGLFYYEFFLVRAKETLFSTTEDQISLSFSRERGNSYRLLLYETTYDTPHRFYGGVMYHIFLDRFCRGKGKATLHEGATLDEDWEHGIPEYPDKPGDELANNRFFGGNLWGVIEKLDYLASLSVTTLYLSPIFDAVSNHRYDTGDYEVVDSLLGGDEAFAALLCEAHKRGMKVILDGVFNHTGDDSRYFNKKGNYPDLGAYQSERSPYRQWYRFGKTNDDYECWWNIPILPRLCHDNPDCRHYFTGKEGIAARWLRFGADGWRLDVADELSDEFLDELRATVKDVTGGQGLILGEVWENAADKISYGKRRRYLQGKQLDSVMNYPLRAAILDLLRSKNAHAFCKLARDLYASYPTPSLHTLMNLLSTHDTPRILTLLGDESGGDGLTNAQKAVSKLSPEAKKKALELLKIGAVLQFTFCGFPSIYYGDEAGMEGYGDPFCRFPYPWGREDEDLLAFYRELGKVRTSHTAFADGDFMILSERDDAFFFRRKNKQEELLVGVNLGVCPIDLPAGQYKQLFPKLQKTAPALLLSPLTAGIFQKQDGTDGSPKKRTGKG